MPTEASTVEDEVLPQIELERRQDDALMRLDDLNERIENLIELYTRLRNADPNSEPSSKADTTTSSGSSD